MEYSINKLSKMAGVSARTLRYYDEIGLLKPLRVTHSGYRVYGLAQTDALQRILFYRTLGVELSQIKTIMESPGYNDAQALAGHLEALLVKRKQIDKLITNVRKTILASKGAIAMNDKEKFEGLKKGLIDENEKKYGKEIREKYGESAVNASIAKMTGMSEEKYAQAKELSDRLNEALKEAFADGDPAGETAQKACELHKQWLMFFWDKYSKQAHKNLGQMYVDDPRFTAHYDEIAVGCAPFLRDALNIFCQE